MRKTLATVLRACADRFDPPQTFQTAVASTQFAGSGLVINQYGADCNSARFTPWSGWFNRGDT